jgi:hypothetical protein
MDERNILFKKVRGRKKYKDIIEQGKTDTNTPISSAYHHSFAPR